LVAFLTAVVATACTVTTESTSSGEDTYGVSRVTERTAKAFEALRSIVTQPMILAAAESNAAVRCLRNMGFDSPPPDTPLGSTANIPVFIEESTARYMGYGEHISPRNPADQPAIERYEDSLPPDQKVVFGKILDDWDGAEPDQFVTPNGWVIKAAREGCVAKARSETYGSIRNWLLLHGLPQDLNLTASDAYDDLRVRAALDVYASCMKDKDYHLSYPDEARQLAQEHAESSIRGDEAVRREPSPDEIAIAIADAQCQRASAIRDIYMHAFEEGAASWLSANADLVREAAGILNDAVDRARH